MPPKVSGFYIFNSWQNAIECTRKEKTLGKIYLIHFNDGIMQAAVNVEHGVFQAANEGELDIIDITDPTTPTFYYDGVWRKIELVHQKGMKYSQQSHQSNN